VAIEKSIGMTGVFMGALFISSVIHWWSLET